MHIYIYIHTHSHTEIWQVFVDADVMAWSLALDNGDAFEPLATRSLCCCVEPQQLKMIEVFFKVNSIM
jgi:hypothetical protein